MCLAIVSAQCHVLRVFLTTYKVNQGFCAVQYCRQNVLHGKQLFSPHIHLITLCKALQGTRLILDEKAQIISFAQLFQRKMILH